LIKKNPDKKTGDLYKAYLENGGKSSQKTFSRRLKKLEEGKFIVLEKSGGGSEGNTSTIKLSSKQPTERKLTEF